MLRVRGEQLAAAPLEPARREQEHRGVRPQPLLGPRRELAPPTLVTWNAASPGSPGGQRVLQVERVAVDVAGCR